MINGQLFEAQAGGYYDVHFSVRHGINETPIIGASVQLDGFATQTTGSSGMAVFSGVEGGSQLAYTVTHTGYLTEEGSVSVVNENLSVTVLLHPGSGTTVGNPETQTQLSVFRILPQEDIFLLNCLK